MKISRTIFYLTLVGAFALTGCGALSDTANVQQDDSTPPPASTPTPSAVANSADSSVPDTITVNGKTVTLSTMATGVKYYDEVVGHGAIAENNSNVSVLYTGSLNDGKVFDSTSSRGNQPFSFTIGTGTVIPGWEDGVPGMHVGGTRDLVIPSSLGYGSAGAGSIPPGATLHFTIKLLNVKQQAPLPGQAGGGAFDTQ
jgi:FKBP-type peptidyl-prolyl cis-trans isomerase